MVRRATAQDVADLAGVSRSSVSLVLNGRAAGNLSAAKQAAVVEAARQLDYRPNTLALSLRSQRTWTIGVLTWRGPAGFAQDLLHAAWQTAVRAGYVLILTDTDNDAEHEARQVATLLDRQVDAFMVVAPELTEYRPPEALAGRPITLINCADPDRRVTSVVPDEVGAAMGAAQLLLDRGHRRIALVTNQTPTALTSARMAGVQAAMAAAGLPLPAYLAVPNDVAHAAGLVESALRSAEPPSAFVCTHERLALGVLLTATRLQREVPRDLSIITLEDGEHLAAALTPPLATVQRPDRAMAEQAVAVLLSDLAGDGPAEPKQLSFVCPPHLRASVGPPGDGGQPAARR